MNTSRRGVLGSFGLLPVGALAAQATTITATASKGFPYRSSFQFPGVFLDAAYVHPLGDFARNAAEQWLQVRSLDVARRWPRAIANPRESAIAKFAKLINADPATIAIVPSTMGGENLVAATLKAGNGGNGFGVVTDEFHYPACQVIYKALYSDPYPVRIAKKRGNRIDLADIDALIDKNTKLVSVSLVSSQTGFCHDLKALCEIAHRKGALVYADIIQAAGAMPVDVQDSGVDFCCAAGYKWLMGEFGPAFLYVRPDRLHLCKRVQLGWYGIPTPALNEKPVDASSSPEAALGLGSGTSNIFEVSTPAFGALAVDDASIGFILETGVDAIASHRQPLIDRLQDGLADMGLELITPKGTRGPIASFAYPNALNDLSDALKEAKITITLGDDRIRISPSIYNDLGDITLLLDVLRRHRASK